jgi:hypothetical protein
MSETAMYRSESGTVGFSLAFHKQEHNDRHLFPSSQSEGREKAMFSRTRVSFPSSFGQNPAKPQ